MQTDYEATLDKHLKDLQECQKEHNLKSCSKCDKYLNCETRQSYVKSVYDSMSKGETGGFEF